MTTRLKAQAEKAEKLQTVAAMSEMQNTGGLSNHEIATLVAIMSETVKPEEGLSVYILKDKMGRSGYTPMAAGLAVESLMRKDNDRTVRSHRPTNARELPSLSPHLVGNRLAAE